MDRGAALKAAGVQALGVAVLAVALGLALPHSFFEDWGWLAGPGAWALAALTTARVLRLPLVPVLAGAAVAGLPSLAAVLLGVHWLGAALAIVLLGAWCGRLAARPRLGPSAPA